MKRIDMTIDGRRSLDLNARARHRGVALGCIVLGAVSACSAPGPGIAFKDDELPVGMSGQQTPGGLGGAPNGSMTALPGSPAAPNPSQNSAQPADVLLDDLEDGNGTLSAAGFTGSWTTYSDGTSQVTPPTASPIVPTEGAIHVTGSGFSEWGVGLSVDLNNPGGQRQAANVSTYRGVSVRARGTGSVEVEIVTVATTGTEEGGSCTGDGCFGHHAARITLGAQYADHEIEFGSLRQPDWAQTAPLDLTQVLGINFLSRAEGSPASIDLWVDSLTLLAPETPSGVANGEGGVNGPLPVVGDGSNPFAGRTLYSDAGAAFNAYNSAQGADRELLGKIALNPTAFWLVGGDPGQAGRIADASGGDYPVLVAYYIPDRDCNGESAGGAPSAAAYQDWIDGMASSLQGKQAAVILEPDALALSCGESTESLIAYAVRSLRTNPGVAVYIDGGHSNWVPADQMANRLRSAGIEQATGFAVNVSNFQPTSDLVNYGKSLSGLLGGKPFIIDTSRNGRGARGAEWCNPAGAGLGEKPTTATEDPAVHALLWVKRPGESDGACGQCAGTPAGQFCVGYALELARNAVF